jgi:hypothetical protein
VIVAILIHRLSTHRSSDPATLLIFCVIGFIAGIALFFQGFRLLERRRLILDTPFSNIRGAAMGLVEISGQAVGPYTMIAPITERQCYYFRTVVWEWKQQGKNKAWVKIAADCMHLPFFVDDNTGRVLIDPRGADLDLHRDFEQEFCDSFFTTKDAAPGNVRSFLARHGISTNNKIKVEEYCIKPKNSFFILGTLAENPGLEVGAQPIPDMETVHISSHGFALPQKSISFFMGSSDSDRHIGSASEPIALQSESPLEVVRLSSEQTPAKASDMSQQQKIAAALLRAGISNSAGWAAVGVRSSAGVQVVNNPAPAAPEGNGNGSNGGVAGQANGFDLRPPVVLMKGTNSETFLISWRSQKEVARSLGWKCLLMIWGGPALALLGLYFFLRIKSVF